MEVLPYIFFSYEQLGMLISCAQANLTENDLALFNRCALFVCNKWDCVDSNEQEKVKEEQIKLLSKKVFNLDPNAQMVHLSCKIAHVCQTRLGYVTEGFHDLTTGICNLLVSSMQNKLEMHYRYVNKGGEKISHCLGARNNKLWSILSDRVLCSSFDTDHLDISA